MIVVAGAAGFIGKHLSLALKASGYDVLGLDNFYSSKKCDSVICFDVENAIDLNVSKGSVKVVINLASPASPVFYQKDKLKTIKTNFLGTLNLLDFAYYHGASFIQASTSEIYGDPLVMPQTECYNGNVFLSGPRACYDEGKRAAEVLVQDHPLNKYQIVRIFNTYGPGMLSNDGRVVSNFITQALRGDDITVYGDGMQTRCLCYISDMVDFFLKVIKDDLFNPHPVNVGNDYVLTVNDIAKKVIYLTESCSKIINHELPENDPVMRQPCLNRVRRLYGWNPKVDIDDGLISTIDYFKGQELNVND